jgi:hypothetical protein
MTVSLPKKCFVSHSYRDMQNKGLLLRALPPHVEPFFFPPITVTPDQMVSNDLIRGILDCQGVVYINGGLSAQSFWVAFERDFAKRAKLPVFEFDPTTSVITPDESPPLHLPAFPSYAIRDRSRVDQILACMRHERFFDTFIDREDLQPGAPWAEELGNAISSRLRAGGYVVAFLSAVAASSAWVRQEVEAASREFGDRVIFAWLDHPQSLPHEFPVPETQWVVLHRSDDESRLNWNEIDRLIVMLYWRIYRNTRANGLH